MLRDAHYQEIWQLDQQNGGVLPLFASASTPNRTFVFVNPEQPGNEPPADLFGTVQLPPPQSSTHTAYKDTVKAIRAEPDKAAGLVASFIDVACKTPVMDLLKTLLEEHCVGDPIYQSMRKGTNQDWGEFVKMVWIQPCGDSIAAADPHDHTLFEVFEVVYRHARSDFKTAERAVDVLEKGLELDQGFFKNTRLSQLKEKLHDHGKSDKANLVMEIAAGLGFSYSQLSITVFPFIHIFLGEQSHIGSPSIPGLAGYHFWYQYHLDSAEIPGSDTRLDTVHYLLKSTYNLNTLAVMATLAFRLEIEVGGRQVVLMENFGGFLVGPSAECVMALSMLRLFDAPESATISRAPLRFKLDRERCLRNNHSSYKLNSCYPSA